MKRVLSLLLVVMLLAGLSVGAFAADDDPDLKGIVVDSPAFRRVPGFSGPEGIVLRTAVHDKDVNRALVELAEVHDIRITEDPKYAAIAQYYVDAKAAGTGFEEILAEFTFKAIVPENLKGTSITLDPVKDFMGMFKLVKDDKGTETWTLLTEAADGFKLNADNSITFVPENGMIYCVFVGQGPRSDATGESANYAYLVAAIALAGGAVYFFVKSRKAIA